MVKIKRVRACPKCGSIDVKKDDKEALQFIGGISPQFKCNNCKFTSILFPEVDVKNLKQFQKNANYKSKKKKR